MTDEPRLTSFPVEILSLIAEELNVMDLCNLRLINRFVASTTYPLIFDTLCINLRTDIVCRNLEKLKAIVTGECPMAITRTMRLVVTSLVPHRSSLGARYPDALFAFDDDFTVGEAPHLDGIEKDVLRVLIPALSLLKNVHTVRWITYWYETMEIRQQFFQTVLEYPKLRSFEFCDRQGMSPKSDEGWTDWKSAPPYLPFEKLRDLETFNITTRHDPKYLIGPYRAVLFHSPSLSTLGLSQYSHAVWGKLQVLFDTYPASLPPLSIRSLVIDCPGFTLEPSLHPHVRNLKSLVVRDLDFLNPYDFVMDDFWSTWAKIGVQVEELCVDRVPPKLVQYLLSYSGLRKLRVEGGYIGGEPNRTRLASRIWGDLIVAHAPRLRELSITGPHVDLWAYTKERCEKSLLSCAALKRLGLSMEDRHSESSMHNGAKILSIAMGMLADVAAMPNVQTLSLSCDERTEYADQGQEGTPDRCRALLRNLTESVFPPDTFGSLKYLHVAPNDMLVLRTAVDQEGNEGCRWDSVIYHGEKEWDVASIG